METATLIALYTSFDTALRVKEDLKGEGFDADAVTVLGPHTAGGDPIQALTDRGVPAPVAQRSAEGLRRGGTLVVAVVPQVGRDRALAVIDRHNPSGLESLGEIYLEPGWSRADQIAGDQGVIEVADDLLNVKRPGENAAAFRPLAPGAEELSVPESSIESPEPGSGEPQGGRRGAGPER